MSTSHSGQIILLVFPKMVILKIFFLPFALNTFSLIVVRGDLILRRFLLKEFFFLSLMIFMRFLVKVFLLYLSKKGKKTSSVCIHHRFRAEGRGGVLVF